ncbi:MAG: SpoIID/LytB domain-containing protein [bacterium]|nr:SpoIID/LytB domain-containing protein [bacterium]
MSLKKLHFILFLSLSFFVPQFSFADDAIPMTEPTISVGLWKTKETVKFTSPFPFAVYAGGALLGQLAPDTEAKLSFTKGEYVFKSADLEFTNPNFIRLEPMDLSGYFIVLNLVRKTGAKSAFNYNAYRGEMLYKYSPKSGMPFVINRLPLDSYVAGIGEAPDTAPEEYLKALLVAARSYGYYFVKNANSKDMFNVYASTVDQLYLGYYLETLRPRVAAAAAATYGEMVNYDDAPVMTPYFGNSNGTTKLWSKVWGGKDKPWIQPVVCEYDKGKKQWGHGVGMSTRDAQLHALKDGWTYDQILSYYYIDTFVERMY